MSSSQFHYRARRFARPLAVAGLVLAAAAAATPPPPSLVVDADHSTAVSAPGSNTGKATYTGHVVITRGTTVIHGDRADVYTRRQRLERAVVTGSPATFTWQGKKGRPVNGHAQTITYRAKDDTLTLEGQVVVVRGRERFSAAEAVYALDSQTLTAHGNSGERVHVVVPPSASTSPR